MCTMKVNGRCKSTKYYGRRCRPHRALFCDQAAALQRSEKEQKDRIRKEQEALKTLGMGS